MNIIINILFRTVFERKRKGVDWCGNNTMKCLQGDQYEGNVVEPEPKLIKSGPTPEQTYDDNEPHTVVPTVGDIVAVPFIDLDGKSSFWLGKCLRFNEGTVLVGWLELVNGNKYKMKIGASWEEV